MYLPCYNPNMDLNYTFFYVEANIVCIVIFILMMMRDLGAVGRQAKQMIFVNIIISHMLYFVSDIGWVLILGGYIPRTLLSVAFFNILNAILLSAITGFWFVYVELSQGEKYITAFKARIIALVPAMIETVVMIFLFLVFPKTVAGDNTELTATYYVIFIAVPALYISVSSVRSFLRAFRKDNYAIRNRLLVCAVYPVFLTIFGILQVVWINAPIFCFGSTTMMLYVYIISLNDLVSLDELTKLNNRTQLMKYVVAESSKQGAEKAVHYILMIDLNKFKQINDQFGHIEGDIALKRTADALKDACSDRALKTFIARYGGDEFIIIIRTDNEDTVRDLCANIDKALIRINDAAGAAYKLSASIGYSSYTGDVFAFQKALSEADEALYRNKKARASAQN